MCPGAGFALLKLSYHCNTMEIQVTLGCFELRYRMETGKPASNSSSSPNPCLHTETGHVDPLLIEQYNTPGFIGCLSRVQFNGIAPIKSALRGPSQAQTTPTETQPAAASPVSYQGKLVESNCGASPLTIPPMSAATDPWHLDSTGENYSRWPLERASMPIDFCVKHPENANVDADLWAKTSFRNLK